MSVLAPETTARAGEYLRFVDSEPKLKEGRSDGYIGRLHGHFCVFNRWTKIDNHEGRFMERIAPGACATTFAEDRAKIKCIFQHGQDPQAGMKPLGPILELEEDAHGGRYEVGLLDADYVRALLPALKEPSGSLYGASFRFQVLREHVDRFPAKAAHNPDGIEERTITE
ncbi:MAG TPA: HK97 family phage prohead protease, partial [Solirubrobacteraceae bacterium]|nr:HK97 family phage prohead protease [Solirubrobacteraceae bacterium]